jgi:hypothetical protein
MKTIYSPSTFSSPAIGIAALGVASILFTLGFACAVPLAAFAAIAALSFNRRDALAATGAVWLANQLCGFVFMHYPLDGETFAWGAALGLVALLSCETAGLAARRIHGAAGACAAFLAAFTMYEGALIAIDLVTNQSADNVASATVMRIFLINAFAFGVLWAARTLFVSKSRNHLPAFAPRHV